MRGTTSFDDIILAFLMVVIVVVILLPWLVPACGETVKKFLGYTEKDRLPVWLLVLAILVIFVCFYFVLHGI